MLTRPATSASYVCTRCLLRQTRPRRRRLHSQSATPPPPPPPSGAANLTNRRLISLRGRDAPKFLQGLVTANIRPDSRTGLFAAFLTAQGKVLSDAFVYPTLGSQWHGDSDEPGYLVEVDEAQAQGLLAHLKKHKLRSKVALRVLDAEELEVWSVWREGERWTAHAGPEGAAAGGVMEIADGRAPGMGRRVLLPPAAEGRGLENPVPLGSYAVRRYMRGVAEGQAEMPWDECLPMNCNVDVMGGIDFKKGCYLGQELTIRTHHTGVVRRRMLPVALYEDGEEPPERVEFDGRDLVPGTNVDILRDGGRKRATGKLMAGVGNVGLAMCRLEQMSDLTVSGEGSSFTPDDRFFVENKDGTRIGVKAFVPGWLRGQIREPKIQRRVQ